MWSFVAKLKDRQCPKVFPEAAEVRRGYRSLKAELSAKSLFHTELLMNVDDHEARGGPLDRPVVFNTVTVATYVSLTSVFRLFLSEPDHGIEQSRP